VLQHLPASGGAERALAELHRVLRPSGLLLLRTSARPGRAGPVTERYRRFDLASLQSLLAQARLEIVRGTYVNFVQSVLADGKAMLGGAGERFGEDQGLSIVPYPPTARLHRLLLWVLRRENRYVARGGRLPHGHTVLCLARPDPHCST